MRQGAGGDAPLTVNPLRPETLRGIIYRRNGLIDSTDDAVRKDLQETLNLNCEAAYLPENRRAVMKGFDAWLDHEGRRGSAVAACVSLRKKIEASETKPEYAGVLLYLLDRRIRRDRARVMSL